jgi:hypothetical protein
MTTHSNLVEIIPALPNSKGRNYTTVILGEIHGRL